MSGGILRITRGPSLDAGVLVDLNSRAPLYLTRESPVELGEPSFEGGVWSNRTVTLPLAATGRDLLASGLADVARALSGGDAWLLWQRDTTDPPTWFKVVRPAAGALDMQHVWPDERQSVYLWSLSLVCEPFTYGAKRVLEEFTLTNTVGGIIRDLPTPAGDQPTDALVEVRPSAPWASTGTCALGMASWDPVITPGEVSPMWQSESIAATVGAYGAASSSSTAMGGAFWSSRSGSGASDYTMMLAPTSKVAPGSYAVLSRMGGTGTMTLVATLSALSLNGVQSPGRPVSLPLAGTSAAGDLLWSWGRLGDVSVPMGVPAEVAERDAVPPRMALAYNVKGDALISTFLRSDALLLWPTRLASGDGCSLLTLRWQGDAPSSSGRTMHVDGLHRTVSLRWSGGDYLASRPPISSGDFPVLSPRSRNRLLLLHSLGSAPDDVAATAWVRVSYYPRSLHLQTP